MNTTLNHGNDFTGVMDYLITSTGKRIERYGAGGFLKRVNGILYVEARAGDTLSTIRGGWEKKFLVTDDDLKRGYLIVGSYESVRSGTLVHPVFLSPRGEYQSGNPARPSWSSW